MFDVHKFVVFCSFLKLIKRVYQRQYRTCENIKRETKLDTDFVELHFQRHS